MPKTSKLKLAQSDTKGRVTLGPSHANKTFRIRPDASGNLILEPMVAVHEREAWLYKNPEAMDMVRKGIEQSRKRKGKSIGPFVQFADIELED